ncbi:MAG: nucleotidyl transferase AbiEii/AbiGii toxin family protein [Kofleriaceae bacterium]|jgi:predicted nucleotidyltransferase component of viral defense system|nr:nucleotidyl transferase AbiEii/AbiGii toxin family protein [Dermatophilaceae bacterium]MBP9171838.1 nucleotidyl transferase AbiEii/AbiGii toxin family protein [Kofleriaceae bacterium]
MTKTPPKDIGASVRARLLRVARDQGEDFQLVLMRYANERLLFRLASSRYAERFVLKGAALFTLWTGKPHRATRDLDLLGFGDPGVDHMRGVFSEVLTLDVPDDGVRFDLESLTVGLIREEQEYGGVRVEHVARLTNAQVRLQVDVGFGDAITPEPSVVEFPPLLDFPAPRLRAYPRETVVAEKLEAMVQLGMANSRMKDFYDVAVLARDFDFDGVVLARAIRATFERRKTALPTAMPAALTNAFAEDPAKRTQWSGFVRKAGVREAGALAETIAAVRAFVDMPLASAASGTPAPGTWRAGVGWR